MIEEIITDVLKAEGWDTYTNHPADRGGPTKWGITLKAWSEYRGWDCAEEDIQSITEPQARDFYEKLYVIGPRFNHLPRRIMALVIDCGVNHGVRCASKWVQRAIGSRQDGWIGPKTLEAVQAGNHISVFLRIVAFRVKLYGRLVSRDHSQAVFAAGWNNRAAKFLEKLAVSLK